MPPVFPISLIQSLKKSLSFIMGYSGYDDEHTYHFVCLNNSCYRTPMQFYYCMGVSAITPIEERG